MGILGKNKIEIKFRTEENSILKDGTVEKQMKKAEHSDKARTKKMSEKLSDEEKKFIEEFRNRAKQFAKGSKITYNFRGENINFEIKGMQIGRISLNDKKRTMQILTKDNVKWINPITYEDAIKNIDEWINYMKWLLIDN